MQQEATYRPVRSDGAKWNCTDCKTDYSASEVWYVTLPNGWKGIICKSCIDPDWVKDAKYIQKGI
jgi:hypothetical protein